LRMIGILYTYYKRIKLKKYQVLSSIQIMFRVIGITGFGNK